MIAAGLLAAALATASAQAAGLKIAVVDYGALLQASPEAKAAVSALRAEFLPKQKSLQTEAQALKVKQEKLQRNEATMTQDQVAQAQLDLREKYENLAREQQAIQDAVNTRRNELMSKLQKTLVAIVQNYARQHGYDLVLADGVIYSDASLDITPAVLKLLQDQPAHAAAK